MSLTNDCHRLPASDLNLVPVDDVIRLDGVITVGRDVVVVDDDEAFVVVAVVAVVVVTENDSESRLKLVFVFFRFFLFRWLR